MPRPIPRRRAALAASLSLGALTMAVPAAAHVSILEGTVPSGGTAVIHLRIPHGCGDAGTDTLEVQLPEGVVDAQPAYVPGWTVAVEMVDSAPYERFGETLTERVGVIRWSDGDLPSFAFYDFAIRATFLVEPGSVLAFPTVQRCGDAEVAWIEPVVEGQAEPEHPTPTVSVVEPMAEGDGH